MDPHVTDKAGTPAEGNADADGRSGAAADAGAGAADGGTEPLAEDGASAGRSAPAADGSAADAPDGDAGDGGPRAPRGDAPAAGASATAEGDAADTPPSGDAAAEAPATAAPAATDAEAAPTGAGDTPGDEAPAAEAARTGDTPDGGSGSTGGGAATPGDPPEGGGGTPGDGGDASPDGDGDGDGRRKRHWLRWAALGTSVVVLAAAGAGWWFYRKLDANITTDTSAAAELETYERERPTPVVTGAENILLLGSDTREGAGNDEYGKDEGGGGSQRSDTTILLHIAADRKSATAMSVPRDLMVTIPSCRKPDGKRTREQTAQFNWAFQFGGAACTIRTVEKFTGVRIDHHMVIDFRGFKDMVDAVDGVEICLSEPIDDKDAKLKLQAGRQTLHGEEALGFVRARKTLGDGSDTERMERQQQFLGALVKKVQSNGVLLNPTRLYPVLDAATKSITTDPGLDSLKDLYDLTRSLRNVPTEKVQFLTVPRQPYHLDPNRDELVEPEASELFERLREDAPVTVVPKAEKEAADAAGESPSPDPTFSGTNAADGTCG
ncbi:LCP family protein [Streptomyces genisteinicus]|uniref:LCP family protein n=1 Tax=Streptomyces genisteinicus TaxID=2768068 RepID=A0A7H0HSU6_9ACTN|nr:LCP family protein [Streptomyces genisteinicus]QNP63612.1 LCP family protein [Streptomyces genisteinicus]